MSRKVLIATGDGGDSYESLYAWQRFQEARWEPVIAAPTRRRLHLMMHDDEPGWETYIERPGHCVDADVAITAVSAKDFAAILLIGGRAPEFLRNDPSVISLVQEFSNHGKWLFTLGHGIQVLAAADLLRGRTVTGHPHVQIEVEHAGATYSTHPTVRDGKLVTGQSWRAHPEFYREVFACLGV